MPHKDNLKIKKARKNKKKDVALEGLGKAIDKTVKSGKGSKGEERFPEDLENKESAEGAGRELKPKRELKKATMTAQEIEVIETKEAIAREKRMIKSQNKASAASVKRMEVLRKRANRQKNK